MDDKKKQRKFQRWCRPYLNEIISDKMQVNLTEKIINENKNENKDIKYNKNNKTNYVYPKFPLLCKY